MRTVIQRVTSANVKVENTIVGKISNGLLVFLGIENNDTVEEIDWLIQKIINMRIFSDTDGKMNLSVKDIQGEILIIANLPYTQLQKKAIALLLPKQLPQILQIKCMTSL